MPNYSVMLIQFLCRKLYHLLSAMRIRFTAFFSLPCAISISRSPAFFCRIAFARSAASRARATSISSAHSHVRANTTACSAETSTKPPDTAPTRRSPFWIMVRPPVPSAATYGKWFGVELTAENKKQFYIPEGFAHGFLVLSDEAEFA